jgi:transaldolase
MKLFIDTANLDEIREAASWGILDGCTTNPSLIAKEGRDFIETVHEICEIVQGPVSAEVVAQDAEGMLAEARLLRQVHEHIVIKVPMSLEGLKATKALSDEGTPVNVTLIFNVSQAVLAAKAGAAYVSPFIGRIDDTGHDGTATLADIISVFETYDFKTEVLAASIRHQKHVYEALALGSHVATMPYTVIKKMVMHPLTDSGNQRFLDDWASVPGDGIIATVERFLAKKG